MLTVFCSICLCVSFLIAVLAFANFIVSLYKKIGKKDKVKLAKRTGISSFHLLVLGVFVAALVVYLPVYATILQADSTWAIVVRTPLLSAQNVLQLFTINASFDNVIETINTANGLSKALVDIYTVYVAIYFVVAPMLTAAFLLSFVKGLYENWRYFKNTRIHKIYVFSELNTNSLALAKDIVTNYVNIDEDAQKGAGNGTKTRLKRVIVFAGVTQKLEEEKGDLVNAAKELGAICLQKDITEVYLKSPKKQIYRKLYLISRDENENTSQALQLIAQCKKHYNFDTTHIFILANSDESGILIDSVMPRSSDGRDEFNIKVRRVNEKRNLIWSALRQSSSDLQLTLPDSEKDVEVDEKTPLIFSRAKAEGQTKYIDVLIVGLGQYGTELLKTVCWYCQMPGYRLRVHVFDKLAKCEDKVRSIAPELVQYNNVSEELVAQGEAYYNIDFCNKAIDVKEASFADKIAEIPNVTIAFVTLGDDKTNIDTSIQLRRIFGKTYADKGFKVPPILTVVYDTKKTENLEHGKLLKSDIRDGDYNIRFIGDVNTSYSLRNIEQLELERVGLACHMHWAEAIQGAVVFNEQQDMAKLHDDWRQMEKQYNTYEYNRRSSMAQAMHLMARTLLCKNCSLDELIRNEHNRWNAFMRSDGYTVSPEVDGERLPRDTIAKIHPCLVPFDKLKDDEKEKDSAGDYMNLVADYEQKSRIFANGFEKSDNK
ncbi:MAG: hypothetical protein J1G02_04525 [Clostridiales bacterium]|nr:hypothetical protein [Clostridiales bacterium]